MTRERTRFPSAKWHLKPSIRGQSEPAVTLINELIDKGIKVNILNIGVMDNTPSSKLTRNIFFAFAEYERDMIVERTSEGREIAKQKVGYQEGRPKKFSKSQIDLAVNLLSNHSYKQVSQMTGISKSTLQREKRKYIS